MKIERMTMACSYTGGRRADQGFTLIELMIVVAIVAILAAVAYPSYIDSVRAARRADAMDALLTLQNLQEKYRANNTTFGTLAQIGGNAASTDGRYNLAVTVGAGALGEDDSPAVAYTLTVEAQGDQENDEGCAGDGSELTLTIDVDNPQGVKTPAACWKN